MQGLGVVDRECPVCGVRKPLRFFRRWRGRKKVLHAECNACGEVTLSAMRPVERLNAVVSGKVNASLVVVDRMNARDLAARGAKMSHVQRVLHSGKRKRQWEHTLGTRLRQERDWARRSLLALPSEPPASGWAEFFDAYITVLTDMLTRYVAKYNRVGTRTMPTVEEAHPMTYTTLATVRSLALLYAACRPIRGRRTYRDPWCLAWRDYVPVLVTEKEKGVR